MARFARLPRAAALRTPRRAAKLCQSRSTLVARSPLRKGEKASANQPARYLRTRGAPRDASRRDAASRSARNIRRRRAHFRGGGVAFSPTRRRVSDVRPFVPYVRALPPLPKRVRDRRRSASDSRSVSFGLLSWVNIRFFKERGILFPFFSSCYHATRFRLRLCVFLFSFLPFTPLLILRKALPRVDHSLSPSFTFPLSSVSSLREPFLVAPAADVREERDANEANFRSRIDFLSRSSS